MKSKDALIVRYLIENKSKEINILRLSKELKVNYKNAYSIIKRLEEQGIVKLEIFGKSSRINLVSKIHPIIFEAEYLRRQEILKNKNFSVMYDSFKGLHSKFFVMLIFGSYAKKNQTKTSDIDLMFILPDSDEERIEKEAENIAGTIPLKIHYSIIKESDFIEMKKSREPTIVSEAIMNNVILYGIEAYYEMIR